MEVEMEEDEEFLSQVAEAEAEAEAEAHALCMSSTKRRKVTTTNSSISLTKTKPSADGLYTAALKGAIVKWSYEDLIPEKQCPCGVGACVVFSANPRRKFYKCPLSLGQESSCGFFKWCNEQTVAAGHQVSATQAYNDMNGISNDNYGVRTTRSSCFKCGKEGHWAKDCPNSSSNSPAELGEKSASASHQVSATKFYNDMNRISKDSYGVRTTSSSCFKCGKEGHWAKDCPNPSSNSPVVYNDMNRISNDNYGVRITSSSCFKCGKEGHWAKDCTNPSSNSPAELGGKSASAGHQVSATKFYNDMNGISNDSYGVRTTSSSCFKCGKEGHWAKDCPNSSSNSPAEMGRKSASSVTYHKCGKPGHWARDCSASQHMNVRLKH